MHYASALVPHHRLPTHSTGLQFPTASVHAAREQGFERTTVVSNPNRLVHFLIANPSFASNLRGIFSLIKLAAMQRILTLG